jgi:hypothetical protein
MAEAKQAGRITRVPYDAALPVDTDWDLGIGDNTAIWFSQSLRSGEVHLIDYHEDSGQGIAYYANLLHKREDEFGYVYGTHWAPHDIAARELGTGKSRLEVAREHGDPGLEALRHYRWDWNTRLNEFKPSPVHDWASHGADAFRGLAVRHQIPREKKRRRAQAIAQEREFQWT